ncbi:MAG: YdbL family protein [Gammaproteobacteria bacterium]|nr:YdbL family protein [Gammaproteobacteria bacterium]
MLNDSVVRFHQLVIILLMTVILMSCVTINIYFPAAEAEKVAEQIIDDVLDSSDTNTPIINETHTENNQSSLDLKDNPVEKIVLTVLEFIIPSVQAAQANLSINSSKIRSIRSNMEKRQSKLLPYYRSGNIGFTHNGLIASVSSQGLSVKKKSTAKKLIDAENNDRRKLYAEIANANGHPEWKNDIQKTFSKTWIKKISSGWMYQSQSGQWLKK